MIWVQNVFLKLKYEEGVQRIFLIMKMNSNLDK